MNGISIQLKLYKSLIVPQAHMPLTWSATLRERVHKPHPTQRRVNHAFIASSLSASSASFTPARTSPSTNDTTRNHGRPCSIEDHTRSSRVCLPAIIRPQPAELTNVFQCNLQRSGTTRQRLPSTSMPVCAHKASSFPGKWGREIQGGAQ